MNCFQLPLRRQAYQMRAIPPIENDQNEPTATRTKQFRGARTSVLLTFDFKLLTSLPLRAPKCARIDPDVPPRTIHPRNSQNEPTLRPYRAMSRCHPVAARFGESSNFQASQDFTQITRHLSKQDGRGKK